jgi:shikimate kinase
LHATESDPAPPADCTAADPPVSIADSVRLRKALGTRSIVLIGMMGAGKSSVGRRLAARLGLPFVDADTEIETAAGMTISDIFARHGEAHFREGERKVIARLLGGGPQVLATGGGAWMNEQTRRSVAADGVSVWLKADIDTLVRRVRRRNDRPLLHGGDVAAKLRRLSLERDPVYALADIVVRSRDVPHDEVVTEIIEALTARLAGASPEASPTPCPTP